MKHAAPRGWLRGLTSVIRAGLKIGLKLIQQAGCYMRLLCAAGVLPPRRSTIPLDVLVLHGTSNEFIKEIRRCARTKEGTRTKENVTRKKLTP